jgi:predicted PolB exonuclease-like 3'-5' exonuclease
MHSYVKVYSEWVNWGKIKIIKIDKKEEHTVMFKYSYDDDNYKKINVEKNLKNFPLPLSVSHRIGWNAMAQRCTDVFSWPW